MRDAAFPAPAKSRRGVTEQSFYVQNLAKRGRLQNQAGSSPCQRAGKNITPAQDDGKRAGLKRGPEKEFPCPRIQAANTADVCATEKNPGRGLLVPCHIIRLLDLFNYS